VIKVTVEPSMAIRGLVFWRFWKNKNRRTLLPKIKMEAMFKKEKVKSTLMWLCMLFKEYHVCFLWKQHPFWVHPFFQAPVH